MISPVSIQESTILVGKARFLICWSLWSPEAKQGRGTSLAVDRISGLDALDLAILMKQRR